MIRLENIQYLNYLWAIPLLILLFLWFLQWKRTTLKRYGEPNVIFRLIPERSKFKDWFKFALMMLALAALIVGIANPQIGSQLEKQERQGVDIIIALDVSNSMLAEDIKPNRIERARQAVSRFIDQLTNDRIGLIIFAGKAYPLLPLTNDYSAAKMFLANADNNLVQVQGTSIADAIDLAMRSFPSGPQGKALVIITDGEDHEGEVLEKVEEAKRKGILIHTIGIGSPQGVPIPLFRNDTRAGFRTSKDGQTVITRLNESVLQQIAVAGQGVYVRATNAQFGLNRIFDEISKMEKGTYDDRRSFAEFESRFWYFLYLTLILLMLEMIIYERSSRWMRKLSRFIPVVLLLMSFNAQAQSENKTLRRGNKAYENEKFQDAERHYAKAVEANPNSFGGNFNLGNAMYKQENFRGADSAFLRSIASQTNRENQSKAFYNYGNALIKNQMLAESVEAYKQALRLNPNDEDARHNLVYAMNMLQQQQGQQNQQQDGDGKEDKQQDNQQGQQDQKDGQQDQNEGKQEQAQEQQGDKQQKEGQQAQQISKQEAERMLQALNEDEQKTLEKVKQQKFNVQMRRTDKDW